MQKPAIETTQQCYALCIGINTYDDQELSELHCAENDAQAMYNLFLQWGFPSENCCLLRGQEATTSAISDALKSFILTKPKKNDLVIFYFAGHGVPISEPVSDEDEEPHSDVFLSSHDMNPRLLLEQRGEWWGYPLRLGELRNNFFERSASKKLLFILDSCHSGDFFGATYRSDFSATDHIHDVFSRAREGRVVLSSCMPQQRAYESIEKGHGWFTYYLLQALRGEKRDAVTRNGKLTLSSLFDFLSQALPEHQRPVESGVKHGSFELWYFPDFDEARLRELVKEEQAEHIAQRSVQAVDVPPPFILPLQDIREEFTGRDAEMERLKQLLLTSDSSSAIVAGIVGTGGMGKSTLACHFASMYRSHFPDGIIGLEIEGRDLTTLARVFADHLHDNDKLDPNLSYGIGEIMQRKFHHKRALLILDNFDLEEAKNGKDAEIRTKLRQLLPGGKCAVIITTRDRSMLSSFGLPEHACIPLQHFTAEESKRLLTHRLPEERVIDESQAIEELHRMVGGLPLALTIASSMLKDEWFISLPEYVERLRKERDELARLPSLHYANLDIRATFNLSLNLLSKRERMLFACLGACTPEGFSFTTARVVSNLSKEEASESMAKFYRLSLVNKQTGSNRFVLHSLLHAFAREIAHTDGWLDSAEQRHTDYFVIYVREHEHERRKQQKLYLDAMTREIEAILLTMKRLLATDLDEAVIFYVSLEPFFQQRGYWEQAMALIDERLQVARAKEDYVNVTHALLQRSQFLFLKGRFSDAETALDMAREEAAHINNTELRQSSLAKVLTSLGAVYPKLNNRLTDAVRVLQEAATIEEHLGNLHGKGIALHALGNVYKQMGQSRNAISVLEESYDLLVRTKDLEGQAKVLNSLGGLYQRQGELEEAREVLQLSRAIGERLGLTVHVGMVLNTLGQVYDQLGDFPAAIDALQKSLHQRLRSEDLRGEAVTRCTWGKILLSHNKVQQAIEQLEKSFNIDEQLRNKTGIQKVAPALLEALQQADQFRNASRYCERALKLLPHDKKLLEWKKKLANSNQKYT